MQIPSLRCGMTNEALRNDKQRANADSLRE
jgi:hypothetical protein